MIQKSKRFIVIFIISAGIWLFPVLSQPENIPFHPNATNSDLLVSHWPNAFFVRSELANSGTMPLWNPQILSGAPLVADPLFGIWYPPNWLALILPITLAFNLLFWFHLFWAGVGFYKFMRAEGFSVTSAIVAGLAFSGTPKLIGHIALGHPSLVAAVAWTPWVLLTARRALDGVLMRWTLGTVARLAALGALLGLIFLIDPRWVVPLSGLTAAYIAGVILPRHKLLSARTLGAALTILAFAVGVASALVLPLIEFTLRSTRTNLSIAEAGGLSLPIQDLLGLILPPLSGWPETMVYVGTAVLGLALVAALTNATGWRFWGAIFGISLLIALGSQTPLYEFLARIIPGFGFLRVPARFLFISAFALAVLCGMGLEKLLHNAIAPKALKRMRLGALAYWGVVLLLGFVLLTRIPSPAAGLMIFLGFGSMGALLFTGKSSMNLKGLALFWGIFLVVELLIVNRSLLEARPIEEMFQSSIQLPHAPSQAGVASRVFSPSYSVPQHIAALKQIQLADGVNPLQLRSYWEFMADAVGFDERDYSVTLPPFPDGDPSTPQVRELDIEKLGMLNIGTIISAYPLDDMDLEQHPQDNNTYIYTNLKLRPRAWIESDTTEGLSEWRELETLRHTANEIDLSAIGPGLLVLSELDYPGWEAFIDGEKSPIRPYMGILRSVELSAGLHEIHFRFRPTSVYIGLGISLFTLFLLAVLWRKQ